MWTYGRTTGCSYSFLVDRFNIAVDDWSALSESDRRDAVLHLLHVAGGLDIAFLTGFYF